MNKQTKKLTGEELDRLAEALERLESEFMDGYEDSDAEATMSSYDDSFVYADVTFYHDDKEYTEEIKICRQSMIPYN